MRLVVFDKNNVPTLGLRDGEEIVDLSVAAPDLPSDLKGMLQASAPAFERAKQAAASTARVDAGGVRFHPLMRNAPKIICLGLNYAAHAAEGGFEVPKFPTVFLRAGTSLVGHNEPIVRPLASEQLDYEAELALFIGKA